MLVLGALSAGPANGSQRGDFLLSPTSADRMVPQKLQPLLARVRPLAANAVRAHSTTLGKTLALERLVHTVLRPTSVDCWGYATVMTALGRNLGLPLRITVAAGSASDYDTHTTVSVWLTRYRSWAIVDPTFGGTFTRGNMPRPLNAVDLHDALVDGWWRAIRWHPSARDSTPLSEYYVDPLFLFRYVGAIADVDGSPQSVVLPDSGAMPIPDYTNYTVTAQELATAGPAQAFKTRRVTRAPDGIRLTLPLPYAPKQVWRGKVTLPATIAVPRGSLVIWTSRPGLHVGSYGTTAVDGGSLSPVFVSGGKVRLNGYGRTTVRIFMARRA